MNLKALIIAGLSTLQPCFTTSASVGQLDIPFQVDLEGSVAQAELEVVAQRLYSFYLRFRFRKDDTQDRDRVMRLLGFGSIGSGKPLSDGISIPVLLSIDRIENGNKILIYQKMSTFQQLESWDADSFSKVIDRIVLDPGKYEIIAKSLKNNRNLEDVDARFNAHIRPTK